MADAKYILSLRDITLVLDTLNTAQLDARSLKTLLDMESVVMDAPDSMLVFYPAAGLVIQLADRRIRITLQKESPSIDILPLWQYAHTVFGLVKRRHNLVAYGYNYDVIANVQWDNLQQQLQRFFPVAPEFAADVLEGTIDSFMPRIRFTSGDGIYDLWLQQLPSEQLNAHLNVHFDSKQLPSVPKLKASFSREHERFLLILDRLIGASLLTT